VNLRQLATQAARAAARLRADHGIGPADAVCPFDLAEQMGVVVRLLPAPSMEGMYSPDPKPTILVAAERPAGRRRYTCSHEIGHHVFGHGTRLDALEDGNRSWDPEEFVAHRFASGLLMPKIAVDSAFARRGLSVLEPSPESVLVVAQDLGVGYTTLLGHLERTLACVSSTAAEVLRRVSLPRLRSSIAGFAIEHDLVVLDECWGRRAIDIEVGDVVTSPGAIRLEGNCAILESDPSTHVRAVTPGIGNIVLNDSRPVPVRVSRRRFSGLARFRYLEEVDDEQ
jgi:hypothetical protein